MSTYTVTAERSGRWWVLQAEEAPGAISQVSRLDQADQIIEAIAFVTGEPEDSIEIVVRPILPEVAEEARERAEAFRATADQASTAAAAESRRAARELAAAGYSMRDIGTVLGVSFQRAQQLATAAPIELPLHWTTGDSFAYIDGGARVTALVHVDRNLVSADDVR